MIKCKSRHHNIDIFLKEFYNRNFFFYKTGSFEMETCEYESQIYETINRR